MIANFSDICAVVPAAGSGKRMQTECPKQYLFIGNKTILEHSVSLLIIHPRVTRIVIIISPNDVHFATLPLARHPKITVVNGGVKRSDSVLAGIQEAEDAQWVLVHDAVRPCLHQNDLIRLLTTSDSSYHVGSILAAPISDTIKYSKPGKDAISYTVDRTNLWRALTPQFFPRKLLYDCLTRSVQEKAIITDEASALEYCGFHPLLIKGRADNIKVTNPEDFLLAEFYLIHSTF